MEKRMEYMEKTRELMTNEEVNEWTWKGLSDVMIEAAKVVCGETTKSVANPWTVGYKEELDEMQVNTVRAVRTRGERLTAVNEMREMD